MKEMLARFYAFVFARPRGFFQAVNHTLYHLGLRGMGFNNGWQPERSGEEWFIRNVLASSPCRVAFDIGANVGEYSKLLLKHTDMEVHAFEPLPLAYQVMTYIDSPFFTPYNFAFGRQVGRSNIHYGDSITEHASLSDAVQRIDYVGMDNTKMQEVSVETIDHFMTLVGSPTYVDFIKIDVEGLEYDVLAGALQTLVDYRPRYIQIEWNLHQLMTGHTLLDFADLLGSDYLVFQLLPHGMRKVDPRRPEVNTYCYGNFVFIRFFGGRS